MRTHVGAVLRAGHPRSGDLPVGLDGGSRAALAHADLGRAVAFLATKGASPVGKGQELALAGLAKCRVVAIAYGVGDGGRWKTR